ncbi:MAG TPA: maleylpyruvate isomerase N-terminal domain-containing protein [Thermoanaerobaculia bacterium]|nr:maleylpyruvate isomerase N-terminal domain-containing protein [Thermoanaerobaculia bacterium]
MPPTATSLAAAPQPLQPTLAAHLFPPLGRELVALLRGLPPEAWERATVCRAWTVKDIAAHLLDTALRRLSVGRDRHVLAPPPLPITGYRDLVGFLNGLNAEWVTAMRRVSPQLLTELLAWVEPPLAAHLATVDPFAPALFSVAWAGEESSAGWFDVARELTERWLHQQQIRLAVEAPPLADAETSAAVFDTFLRALPHTVARLNAPAGTELVLEVRGARTLAYTLRREERRWQLMAGAAMAPAASAALDEQTAWLLLTKGMPGGEARDKATIEGDAALLAPFFDTVAVMA